MLRNRYQCDGSQNAPGNFQIDCKRKMDLNTRHFCLVVTDLQLH